MRWLWFITSLLLCALAALFIRQPIILVAIIPLFDLFITRRVGRLLFTRGSMFRIPGWLSLVLWAILTTLIIRVFIIESTSIHNSFTKAAMQEGDQVIISKLHFGPRLPVTPLSLPFAHHYLPFGKCRPSYIESVQAPYKRMNGFRKIRRGDLVAYNFPEGDSVLCGSEGSSYYALRRKQLATGDQMPAGETKYRPVDRRDPEVGRCAGIAGDTIRIVRGRVYVNSSIEPSLRDLSYDYLVETDNNHLPVELLEQMGIRQTEITSYPGLGYSAPLRHDQVPLLGNRSEVKSINPVILDSARGDFNIFPHDYRFPWNRDHFGPVIVPGRGDSIRLTSYNLPVYERIISVYENNHIEILGDSILINEHPAKYYTFRQNYYFIMGDNRHHSRDSRHWGFLPEDHMTGKPVLIWFSAQKPASRPIRIYWKRILTIPL